MVNNSNNSTEKKVSNLFKNRVYFKKNRRK